MELDFGPLKSDKNRSERGFGFGYAARVFLGRTLISFARVSDGEVRMKAVGEIEGTVYAVIFIDTGNVRRIISARLASRKERQAWFE